jgi:heavy metal efflux system protein
MFNKIIQYSINNKLVVALILLSGVIWGISSMLQLPIDAVPDVTNNQVVILTQCPTLASQEVEQYVTAPLELKIANLQGVEEIRSTSRQGLSVITIVFNEAIEMYKARQMVSEQIKMAEQNIPIEFGKPEMAPTTTGLGEIYQYTIVPQKGYEDKYSLTDLRTIQDWIVKRQLAGVDGVIEISSFGGYVKQYEISVKPDRLKANDISLAEVYESLSINNANTGASYIEKNNQAYFIRGEGVTKTIEDIESIAIKNSGTPLLISDIATVSIGHSNRFGAMTRAGIGETVGGIVLMLKGADSEKTIKGVKERIARIEKTLPEGLKLLAFIDRTQLIDRSVGTISKNLLEGGLIVVFVLILLLGSIRAGFLVASVIPITMIITFGFMKFFGISANLMSLGAIDFGLLVDCSIIVVEAVLLQLHTSKQFKIPLIPQSQMDSLVDASASKVLSSAVFGGFIILIVYLPILSLTGVEGKMFGPMAQTVSIAILIAIMLSLTYIPMASALFLRNEGNKHFRISDKIVNTMYAFYEPSVKWALKSKSFVIGLAFGLLVLSGAAFWSLGGEFIPTLDEGDIAVDFQTPSGSSLSTSIEATIKAQKALLKQYPEIKEIVGRIGSSEVPTDPMPPEMSDLIINMKDRDEWTSADSREEMVEKMTETIKANVPYASIEFSQPIQMRFNEMIAGARSEIVVKIFGDDLNLLTKNAEKCAKIINKLKGVASTKVERLVGLPQISVKYNRSKIAQYGVSIAELNNLLKAAYSGQETGVLFENEKRFDVVVRLDSAYRTDIEQIKQLYLKTGNGIGVSFGEVADISYVSGPAQISRENTKRRINIGIAVSNTDVETLVDQIKTELDSKIKLPAGYYLEYGGSFENLVKAKKRLSIAVPIALLLIFIFLYFTFNSLKQSLMIFTAIPLSAIGGIAALMIRGMPFSISAGIGFIALFGVAVLNGIVLIGYFNQLEKESDLPLYARVMEGVKVRFRPVIMTAAVASLGFLPMAISTSAGAEVQKPLATVVIGGLISATILTLIVLPVIYSIFSKNTKTNINETIL